MIQYKYPLTTKGGFMQLYTEVTYLSKRHKKMLKMLAADMNVRIGDMIGQLIEEAWDKRLRSGDSSAENHTVGKGNTGQVNSVSDRQANPGPGHNSDLGGTKEWEDLPSS
jgi:hypothetical protein